jgi:hypothetical protein
VAASITKVSCRLPHLGYAIGHTVVMLAARGHFPKIAMTADTTRKTKSVTSIARRRKLITFASVSLAPSLAAVLWLLQCGTTVGMLLWGCSAERSEGLRVRTGRNPMNDQGPSLVLPEIWTKKRSGTHQKYRAILYG